jgi:hypothetical protein
MNMQVSPLATPVWPIPGDVPPLLTIVQDQAETIAAQEVLLHAYQTNLNTAQASPPTTATGNSTGTTSLTLAGVTGSVLLSAAVTGTGVPAATSIVAQQSGTPGGAGVYTTNQVTTLVNAALTITPGGGPVNWPVPQDAPTLSLISQQQTAVLRTQNALLQQYQDLLNTSQTTPPATGP